MKMVIMIANNMFMEKYNMRHYTLTEKKIRKQRIRENLLGLAAWSVMFGLIYICLIIATDYM